MICDTDTDTLTVTSPDATIVTEVEPGTYRLVICELSTNVTVDIDGYTTTILFTTDGQTESVFCKGNVFTSIENDVFENVGCLHYFRLSERR